jgi:hypothetical protein
LPNRAFGTLHDPLLHSKKTSTGTMHRRRRYAFRNVRPLPQCCLTSFRRLRGVLSCSITASDSANAPIVSLDSDSPAPAEPSPIVCVAAIATIVALTVTRSPHVNPDASFSKVDTLRQSRRWGRNRHCANKSKSDQRSRHQHGFFLLFCRSGKTAKVCARSYGTSANSPRRLTGFIQSMQRDSPTRRVPSQIVASSSL